MSTFLEHCFHDKSNMTWKGSSVKPREIILPYFQGPWEFRLSLSHHQLLLFDLTLKTLAVAISQYTYPEKQVSIMSAKRDTWVASVYRWHLLLLWRLRWIAVCDQALTTGSSCLHKSSLMTSTPIYIFKLFQKPTITMLLNSLTAKSVSIKLLL